MTPATLQTILQLSDAGNDVATISHALDISPGYVYGILRRERPARSRKPRTATSDTPRMVRGLAAQGIKPVRIAVLCECSKQYVSRILGSET